MVNDGFSVSAFVPSPKHEGNTSGHHPLLLLCSPGSDVRMPFINVQSVLSELLYLQQYFKDPVTALIHDSGGALATTFKHSIFIKYIGGTKELR
jgi:hypothetical protein